MKPSLKRAYKNFKPFLIIAKKAFFGLLKNKKKTQLEMERLAAKEEREQEQLLHQVEKKKQVIEAKTEEIHKQIESEKKAIESQLDREMQAIQRSTRTSFKRLAPIHNYLRTKSKLYYVWHLNPYSSSLHFGALLFFLATSVYFMQAIYPAMYQKALADSLTCTWNGSVSSDWDDPENWTNCNSGIPTETDYLSFSAAPTNNLVMTSNKTVAKVESLTAGNFSKTFDTNYYNLTVNGDFTWQKGTINTNYESELTISGNVSLTGGTINTSGEMVLTGSSSTNLYCWSPNACRYLTIDKDNFDVAVTLDPALTQPSSPTVYLKRGKLDGEGKKFVVRSSTLKIGNEFSGGSATIELSGESSSLYSNGGTLPDNLIINKYSYSTQTIQGRVYVKNLEVKLGTLRITNSIADNLSSELIFSSDKVNHKFSCDSGSGSSIIVSGNSSEYIPVALRSNVAGNDWLFEPNDCAVSMDYAEVKDATNNGTSVTIPNGIDKGGNSGFSVASEMTKIKWIGGTSGHETDFNWGANWQGGSVPNSTQTAYFDSSSSNNATLTASINVKNIVSSDYAGTLNFAGYTSTVRSIIWRAGGLNLSSSTLTLKYFDNSGASSFDAGASKLSLDSSTTASPLMCNTTPFYNVEIIASTVYYLDYDCTVSNNLIQNGGTYNRGRIALNGDLDVRAGNAGSGIVLWNNNTDHTWSQSGGIAGKVILNTERTVTLGSNVSVTNLSIARGSLDVSSNNYAINIAGGTSNKSDFNEHFIPRQGSVNFTGSHALSLAASASTHFYNLAVNSASDYKMTVYGNPVVTNDFSVLNNGGASGSFVVQGDLTYSANADGGTAAITLNGTSDQTYTLSSGSPPSGTLTIDKPSGKAKVVGTGTITSDINLLQGTLEFDGSNDDTFTFTSGKKIDTAAGTFLRYVGVDDTHRANLAVTGTGTTSCETGKFCINDSGSVYANWVEALNQKNTSGTIYAMNSIDGGAGGTNLNWDFDETAYTWDGGASTTDWNTAANWNPDGVPDGNDGATININTVNTTVTTSSDISFGTLTIGGDATYTNNLTLTNNLDVAGNLILENKGTFQQNNMVDQYLAGSLTVNTGGNVTHSTNATTEQYKLMLNIGGDVTVNTGGTINVSSKGFEQGYGEGAATNLHGGGSYGGEGGGIYRAGGATYGSHLLPTDLGSGGYDGNDGFGRGAGAAKLKIAGALNVDGTISSNGAAGYYGGGNNRKTGGGSGGSILIYSKEITGSGSILAQGADGYDYGSVTGGGGRIAIYSDASYESTFSGTISASSGTRRSMYRREGGNGTIYSKTPSQTYGDLILDNYDRVYDDRGDSGAGLPAGEHRFDNIKLVNSGRINTSGITLDLANSNLVADGTGYITNDGTLKITDNNYFIDGYTLIWGAGSFVDALGAAVLESSFDVTITSDGALSSKTNYNINTEKLDIDINSLTIDSGGKIDLDRRGYSYNTGEAGASGIAGGTYGGLGGVNSSSDSSGISYGSISQPFSLGSGGYGSGSYGPAFGGGAGKITVGSLVLNGEISCNGGNGGSGGSGTLGSGSGGSIWIIADIILGGGSITSDGGGYANYGFPSGGGGRIAVEYNDISSFAGSIHAYPGDGRRTNQEGSAGTVFLKDRSEDNGSLIIDANNETQVQFYTPLTAPSETVKDITVQNYGKLKFEVDNTDPIDNTVTATGDVHVAANSQIIFGTDYDGDPLAGLGVTLDAANITVDSGGAIQSTGQGYPAQNGYTGAAGGSGATYGGGGGFGGSGGAGAGGDGAGGGTYGDQSSVTYIGSGGGLATGGAAAGFYKLSASNTLINQGTISSNGSAGVTNGGGGSGGGLLVSTNNLTCGTGIFSVNGGNGAAEGGGGGGGGRGLIVTSGTKNISGCNTQALGGSGGALASSGLDGTIRIQSSPISPTLTVPANSATNQSQETEFTFSTTDPDGDYLRYKLELADDSGFSTNLRTFTQGSTLETQNVSDSETGTISGTFTGQASECGFGTDNTCYDSGEGATFTIDSSTPLYQGKTYYWRVSAIDPEGVDSYDGTPHYGSASTARSFTVAPINKIAFKSSPQTDPGVSSGSCSGILEVEVRNSIDEAVILTAADGAMELNLSVPESATGKFYSNPSCSSQITYTTVIVGSATSNFYYKDTTPSPVDNNYNLIAAEAPDEGLTDANQEIKIKPLAFGYFEMTGYPTTVTAGETFAATDPGYNVTVTVYDTGGNIKNDWTGDLWFYSSDSQATFEYNSINKYTFTSGAGADNGTHTFSGTGFTLRTKGGGTHSGSPQTLGIHTTEGDAYDVLSDPIIVHPGPVTNFYLNDYPRASTGQFVLAGTSDWSSGGTGAPYTMQVSVVDDYNNIIDDFTGKVWAELYRAVDTPPDTTADYSFTYGGSSPAEGPGTAYSLSDEENGVVQLNPTDDGYANFLSNTSGNNLTLRIKSDSNGGVYSDFTINVKPLGLDYFTISTSDTLSREGTLNDQDVDSELNHDTTPIDITVTAYDALGNVKLDYGYNETTGEGRIYFYSPDRVSHSSGTPLTNQEFPYIKTSASDTTQCFEFPITSTGVHTFNQTETEELFNLFKGGRRTIYVSECLTPTDSYAADNNLKDANFSDEAWDEREFSAKTGVLPASSNIATETHIPGSTHTNDDHSNNDNNNLTIGPGDSKLTLSWQNPFDAPMTAEPKIYIYQSSNGVDYSLLDTPRPNVNGASSWQSQEITGLNNNQQYWFKLKLGYKRSDNSYILSDFSNALTETPKAIAPVNVSASQLNYSPAAPDTDHPGEVKVTYSLRFNSTTTFSYFSPQTSSWSSITDSAVSGDKGLLTGNFDDPILHTTYLELNTDFPEKYLPGSFKVRVNVAVEGQGTSNSESNLFTLDTKNPHNASLIINATNQTTADLNIAASDNSNPIRMKVSTSSDYSGASYEVYSTSKTGFNIEGAENIYITFMDNYYNTTEVITPIDGSPDNFGIKDGSTISSDSYRLLLIWDFVDGASEYNIWRSTDGGEYTQIAEVQDNAFININLSSNSVYAYLVTAEDSIGNISLPAGPLSSTPGSAPDVTSDPQVELYGWRQEYGVRAKITWDTDQEADSFVIYSKEELEGGTSTKTVSGTDALIAGDLTMTLNHEVMLYHLDPSTTYYFKSLSKNEIQITGASSVLSFTTPERIPLLIQGMEIDDIGISSAIATWNTSKLSTTILEYSSNPISADVAPHGSVTVTDTNMNTDHSFKLENLNSGTKYYLRAKNTDSDGNTTTSDVYTFSTFALPQISDISVKETSYNTATITWNTNVNADSNVEYSTNQNSNDQTTSSVGQQGKADSTTMHSVTLIGLAPKTTYSYSVISRDQFGNLARSSVSTFTTATDTQSPKILNLKSEVASIGSGETIKYQAIISWDTDEPATSQIEYAQGIGGDYTDKSQEINSLNSSHVVILPDLKANSAYHFRIVSKDLVGNTAFSDDVSLITPPKEKSLLQVIIKSLEDTFSWVGRLRERWSR